MTDLELPELVAACDNQCTRCTTSSGANGRHDIGGSAAMSADWLLHGRVRTMQSCIDVYGQSRPGGAGAADKCKRWAMQECLLRCAALLPALVVVVPNAQRGAELKARVGQMVVMHADINICNG